MTQALVSHLEPADFLLMRKAWIDALPLTHPWKAPCEAIALGEELALGEKPNYVHAGLVISIGAQVGAIEELANGADRTQEPLDERWDIYRMTWRDPGDPAKVIAYCQSKIGTPYDYPGILFLGLERIFHASGLRPEVNSFVCSTLIAEALQSIGYAPWPGLQGQEIAPSDYPGDGMRLIVRAGVLVEGAAA